ncbi:MAG: uroporphyrinogen decarboxylase [Caenispirillum bisanense]|nr:uroporphyrinogen decarboxylase [Caenispirillum bisanense]MCA1971798.1 uroporphyrinogen decarboxylase [Caenispirillum sp.]
MAMSASSEKRFLRALRGEALTPPPFWLMRQAGRYLPEYRATRAEAGDFLSLCYTPDFAVEVTLQPLRRYGFDAAILFSDILVIPDALGQGVRFVKGEGPQLDPIRSAEELSRLDPERVLPHLAPVFETVQRLSREIPQTTALIGFCGAPWTVATYMVEGHGSKDYAATKKWAYGDPEGFDRLIGLLVDVTTDYLIAQVDAGAEALQIFDSWAGVLPEEAFARWVTRPIGEIVRRVHAARPGVPIIGFPRGAGLLYEGFIDATGVDAVSLDTTVPLEWARDRLQSRCCVQGNLDPILVVTGGQAMLDGIDRILEILGRGPFVFNLGHGIVPETPPEHVAQLADRIRSFQG